MRAGPWVGVGPRPGERDRVLVKDRGAAAGEALDGLEALGTGRRAASAYPLLERSCLPNATIAPGRASRTVSGSSPFATRSRIALETAVSNAGRSGKPVRTRSIF